MQPLPQIHPDKRLVLNIKQPLRRRIAVFLLAFARLSRLGMAPLTFSVPILGAFASGLSLNVGEIFGLGMVALCAHIFGFAINDLIDLPLDSTLNERKKHPLRTGEVSRRSAWILILAQIPLTALIYGILLQGSFIGLVLLAVSAALSFTYNLWSKWGKIPRFLPELSLAISIGLLCVAGGLLRGEFNIEGSFFAVTLALVLLLVNSVPSGLKDLKTDSAFGARSFVIAVGTRMTGDDSMTVSPFLKRYTAILQATIFVGMVGLILLFRPPFLIGLLILIFTLYAALHLRMLLAIQSFRALRRSMPLLSGYYNYGALLLFITYRMPIWIQIPVILLVFGLITIPLQIFIRTWRRRYDPVRG